MPFRKSREKSQVGRITRKSSAQSLAETINSKGRGGEPSPAYNQDHFMAYLSHDSLLPDGWGKHEGSFTQKLNEEFRKWLDENHSTGVINYKYGTGSYHTHSPIVFQYRLSRHKRVTVTMEAASFRHDPARGSSKRGFILDGRILAIDGLPINCYIKIIYLDRIVPGTSFNLKFLAANNAS